MFIESKLDMFVLIMFRLLKYVLTFVGIITMNFINMILRFLGYIRVYDIQFEDDVTFLYYFLKLINQFGLVIDITYPKLGICRYINNKYVRYICYEEKLQSIEKISNNYSSKNYHYIKKIEIIFRMNDNLESNEIMRIDVTNAKNNLYDLNNDFTDMSDIVRFYKVITGSFKIDPNNNNISIFVTREKFDDNLLEFITTYDEVQFQ